MDGTDADGEWSDEEVLQSGSQTGLSETEAEDGRKGQTIRILRPRPPFSGHPPNGLVSKTMSQLNTSSVQDPVSLMMDKIDAQLKAIDHEEMKTSWPKKSPETSRRTDHHRSRSQEPLFNDVSVNSGDTSKATRETGETLLSSTLPPADRKDVYDTKTGLDIPNELDPISAQEIDARFKEIMSKKKDLMQDSVPDSSRHRLQPRQRATTPAARRRVTIWDSKVQPSSNGQGRQLESLLSRLRLKNASRPSAVMLSTGYATDNESVKTEDFESKFLSLMVNPNEADRVQTFVKTLDDEQTRRPVPEETSHTKMLLNRPRSCSPARTREKKKSVRIQADNVAQQTDNHGAIMESQTSRRARSISPTTKLRSSLHVNTATLPNSSVLSSYNTMASMNEGVSSPASHFVKFPMTDEKTMEQSELEDLKVMRQALIKTRQELTEIEHTLLDTRELSEDAKSGLMMLEFKRGAVTKEIEKLNEDIKKKQGQLSALDTELQYKLEDLKTMTSMGVSKEECLDIKNLKEENWSLKSKLRNLDSLHAERDELVRQLDTAKDDLIREQKLNRLKTVEVQEEIETLTSRLEEIQNGWARDQDQLSKLQMAFKKMEREKNELIKGKAKEYEEMKTCLKEEVTDTQLRLRKELNDVQVEVTDLRLKVSQLSSENTSKDIQLKNSKDLLEELQSTLSKEKQERSKSANDYKTALNQLKKELSSAVGKMKDSMFLDKQKAIENIKNELEQEHKEVLLHHEEKLHQVMEDLQYQISEKEDEISKLQDVIQRQEMHLQDEIDLQVQEAVMRERSMLEQETEWQLRKEHEESSRRINELMTQFEKDKQMSREMQAEMVNLKKELEEQKRLQREANKEKLLAVSKAKEQMKQQNSAEIERIKFNINQEHENEFDQLREQLRLKEDEATNLCQEKQAAIEREKQTLQALEQTERLVINEINEECQKICSLLGVNVHNLCQSSYKPDFSDSRHNVTGRKSIPVINTALANLRSCNKHLFGHVDELSSELDSLRSLMETVIKEKDEAVENCKLEMERQKTHDLEMLKEKLLKEHVHEMSRVIQECASTNTHLRTSNEYLQRFGDAALLEALQAKDDELHSLEQSMSQWKSELEEKFNTQLQLMMAKEREKYQALQHHTTREQNRISELQKMEIDRLENEVQKLSLSQAKRANKNQRAASPTNSIGQISDSLSVPLSDPVSPGNLKSSQQYLQARIHQLQADNAALRKQRLLASGKLGSTPNLTNPNTFRVISPAGQARESPPGSDNLHWLSDKIKQAEKESIKVNEKAKLNQKLLNNSMDEMAKLQNTLISQNLELQELERAYNDLHKHYDSRPSSPSRNLNVTF